MKVSIELTLTPLQDNFEPPIIAFIQSLRKSGFTVLENSLSTQIFGEYDELMPFLQKEIKTAFKLIDKGVLLMKIVKSDRSAYEPHF